MKMTILERAENDLKNGDHRAALDGFLKAAFCEAAADMDYARRVCNGLVAGAGYSDDPQIAATLQSIAQRPPECGGRLARAMLDHILPSKNMERLAARGAYQHALSAAVQLYQSSLDPTALTFMVGLARYIPEEAEAALNAIDNWPDEKLRHILMTEELPYQKALFYQDRQRPDLYDFYMSAAAVAGHPDTPNLPRPALRH